MTFEEFSQINRQRCESENGFNHALHSWSTSDWFLALLGELGEAANVAKKLNRYRDGIPGNKQSKEELEAMLRAELGDSFVYLDLLAQSLGVQIGEAAREVFNAKSEQLGCPIRMEAPSLAATQEPHVEAAAPRPELAPAPQPICECLTFWATHHPECPTLNREHVGKDGRSHFRVTGGNCVCGWTVINDFEWKQHLEREEASQPDTPPTPREGHEDCPRCGSDERLTRITCSKCEYQFAEGRAAGQTSTAPGREESKHD